MTRARKGGSFERDVCKILDKWWLGHNDDVVFWRSSQSGGRATTRRQKGKKTYGSYGDVAAVNPIGEPLLKLFTIECKRWSGPSVHLHDVLDAPPHLKKPRDFSRMMLQAIDESKMADSLSWMVIHKRDGRLPVVWTESWVVDEWEDEGHKFQRPIVRMKIEEDGVWDHIALVGLSFYGFLETISRETIEETVNKHGV